MKKTIHQYIIDELLTFKPVIVNVSVKKFCDGDFDEISFEKREIYIYVCKKEINYIKEGKQKFNSRCSIDVGSLILPIKGDCLDAYGTILFKNELLLNNYDSIFTEADKNPKGFVNVLGFATINNNGVVRFTQIVYSFLFKRLIVRDDVRHQLPFKVRLKSDFGGKRALYKDNNVISIRTTKNVYKKSPKTYHQSDEHKESLSYPRLEIK